MTAALRNQSIKSFVADYARSTFAAFNDFMEGDRIALLMGFSLLPCFVVLKVHLYFWYVWHEGIDPLELVSGFQIPLLFASDMLLCLILSVVYWFLLRAWRFISSKRMLPLLAMVCTNTAIIVFSAISLKVNQIYGSPLLMLHLRMGDNLVTLRESILLYLDIHVIGALLAGVITALIAYRFRNALRGNWEVKRLVTWPLLTAITGILALGAFKNLSGVYAYGLKKNALVNFVRYYEPLPEPRDLRDTAIKLRREIPKQVDRFVPTNEAATNNQYRQDFTGSSRGNNLILIVLESTADAFIDEETTPNLYRMKQNAIVYDRFYTTAVNSFRANYSIFYSDHMLDPGHFGHPKTIYGGPMPNSSLFEVAKGHGLETALFFSGLKSYTDIGYLWRDKGADTLLGANDILRNVQGNGWVWGAHETQTVEVMGKWLTTRRKRPFFAAYITAYPHHPYHSPDKVKPFANDTWRNRYRNSLHYVDRNVGVLLQHLRQNNIMESTTIAVVGDHGETLDDSRAGHGIRMDLDEMQVPFFLYNARSFDKPEVRSTPGNLLDLAPTLMASLGLESPKEWLGRNLLSNRIPPRRLYVHRSANNGQSAMIEGERIFVRDARAERVSLFRRDGNALNKMSDGVENTSLIEKFRPLDDWFEKWVLLRHLNRACAARQGRHDFCGPTSSLISSTNP